MKRTFYVNRSADFEWEIECFPDGIDSRDFDTFSEAKAYAISQIKADMNELKIALANVRSMKLSDAVRSKKTQL